MDIRFKEKDFIFSYRVGGILINDGKILLQRPKNDDYSIIGGHVERLELSSDALIREFKEELKAEIKVENLIAIGEIFFMWNDKPCHQICLYYGVSLVGGDVPTDGVFHGYDEWDNERVDLDFCWVNLDELSKGIKVYPEELIPHILNRKNNTVHFVSRQI